MKHNSSVRRATVMLKDRQKWRSLVIEFHRWTPVGVDTRERRNTGSAFTKPVNKLSGGKKPHGTAVVYWHTGYKQCKAQLAIFVTGRWLIDDVNYV